jgi:hypothetical protein
LPERVVIGVLTRVFRPDLVDEVVAASGVREQRTRSLPARLTVYFTLALWLFPRIGYDGVLRQLVEGLRWTRPGWQGWTVPSTGSITKARVRLGWPVFAALFARIAGLRAIETTPGASWRRHRVTAIDGTTLDIADTPANEAAFGRPRAISGPGPFPQARVVIHAECGTRALIGATVGGHQNGEQTLALDLLAGMGPGMLVLADRNFPSYTLWRDIAATGADLLWRMSASFNLPVQRVLQDGTYLSALQKGRGRDKQPPITVRVIEYTITDDHGGVSELFCLATTLLDPELAPAAELADLYTRRWQAETLLAALQSDRGSAGIVLRSHHPDGVRAEIWAGLCVYQAIADLICDTAEHSGLDPNRISFKRALTAARRTTSGAFSP